MLVQIYTVYSAILILQCSSYIFDLHYSYIYPANDTGYTVFLQKQTDGFRLIAGGPKNDKLVHCFNTTACQTLTLSVKNPAGYELFGASIDGGNEPGDPIYVCAPRYITKQYRVNGRCFALHDKFKTIYSLDHVYSQVQIYNSTYEFLYAHGQAGFSLKYVDKTDFLLGAPGVLSWKGTVIKHTSYTNKDVLHPERMVERNSYLGYSIEHGEFFFAGVRIHCVIAGAPRGENLFGQVYFFDYGSIKDFPIKIIEGDQLSSYFGSSLLVTRNEVLIGAPMYTTKSYEEGCVFVYIDDQLDLTLSEKICGNHMGGRFGTAMTKIGFTNMYNNNNTGIAISAPFADGAGIVYIYIRGIYGYKEIQQISGKSFTPNTRGFGYSLSNGIDVDKNHYNDIAIGSLFSESLVILRSKKILDFSYYTVSDAGKISISTKNVSIEYCFLYKGRNDTDLITTRILVETDGRIIVDGNRTALVNVGSKKCEPFVFTFKSHAFDNPQPFKIKFSSKLQECPECPVAYPKETPAMYEIAFTTGCGNDNVCTPNLTLVARFENISELVLGSRDTLTLAVSVTNLGETAYLCKMNMTLPAAISKFPAVCSKDRDILRCDISNRVVVNQKKQLQFEFDVKHLYPKLKELNLDIVVSSAGSGNGSYATSNLKLPIRLQSHVSLIGFSNPDYAEQKDKVNFTHEYLVFNRGPSPLTDEKIIFQVPAGIVMSDKLTIYPFTVDPFGDECIENSQKSKRDVGNLEPVSRDVPQSVKYYLDCKSSSLVECKTYHCKIGELNANASIKYKFNIEANVSSIIEALGSKLDGKTLIQVESMATMLKFPKDYQTFTHTILPRKQMETPNMWIWLAIAVAGSIIILAVIIVILYKLNFFARPMREKLLTEGEQKHERECIIVNDDNTGEDSEGVFNDIQF